MKIKTSELSGTALDWAVGRIVIPVVCGQIIKSGKVFYSELHPDHFVEWSPSANWSQGGPLIQSNQIFLEPPRDVHQANYDEKTGKVRGCWKTYESWHATVSARVRTLPPKIEGFPGRVGRGEGETALVAACRAIVASVLVFGDEVDVPDELV